MMVAMASGIAAALREFRTLGEQGDAEAQFSLGAMYYEGWSVSTDYEISRSPKCQTSHRDCRRCHRPRPCQSGRL